jgi:hypothetical protein
MQHKKARAGHDHIGAAVTVTELDQHGRGIERLHDGSDLPARQRFRGQIGQKRNRIEHGWRGIVYPFHDSTHPVTTRGKLSPVRTILRVPITPRR